MAKETKRQIGIIEIVEREWQLDEWREATKGLGRHPFDNYFPKLEWLEREIDAARQKANGRHFREHEDMGWYLERMRVELVQMHDWRAKGEMDDACLCALELGQLMAESRIKFAWEADALRGRKLVEGAASTRKADDAERKAIVEAILVERGKGKRDAFRTAAKRHPALGSEGTFRGAFYKNPSKPSD